MVSTLLSNSFYPIFTKLAKDLYIQDITAKFDNQPNDQGILKLLPFNYEK